MERIREKIFDPNLKETYRKSEQVFTRKRKLPFSTLIILILQKSAKSLKNKLNEFFLYVASEAPSASAFTQARRNLRYEVFIDLNQDAYGNAYYEKGEYETYKGYRLLAIDGSKLRLPDTEEIRQEFGHIRIKNQHITGIYTGGLCSVLYDVLNENVIDSMLAPGNASEIALAHQHLKACQENDLILFDRNYPGYELFAAMQQKNVNFVCRCSSNAFGVVESFIAQENTTDIIVTLNPCKDHLPKVNKGLLPPHLTLRFVKVILSTGEIEILATSLLDQEQHPLEDFQELYHLRWGIETFYDRLKNRLSLENFTGKTAEAVKQDFYATILISNVESEISSDVDAELKDTSQKKHPHKVNKTVSFNTVKAHALELLLCSSFDLPTLTEKLRSIFRRNTIPIRPNRSLPRSSTTRRSLHFHQRIKKFVF